MFSIIVVNFLPISGDINTAAILHLSSIAPKKLQLCSTDFNSYNTVHTGTIKSGGVMDSQGYMSVPKLPGLGVEPNWDALGEPIAVYQEHF